MQDFFLSSDLKTPYFVFDEVKLEKELKELEKSIKEFWPNTKIAYSVKTNSLPYLASYFSKAGICAEVVSEDEYDLVKLCGFENQNIVCNGPIKNRNFVYKILTGQSIINIDSHAELEYVHNYALLNPDKIIKVGIRANIEIESQFPHESNAGSRGSRFGFCAGNNQLAIAIKTLRQDKNVKICGLHLHTSTKTREVSIYQWLADQFVKIIRENHLDEIEYFDIGGGFWGGLANKPQWKDYLKGIRTSLISCGFSPSNLCLIMEPGVSLLAGSFSYYARVVDVKSTRRSVFVVCDGSRIHIDPFFHKTSYFYQTYQNGERKLLDNQKLVGFTCLEYDEIMNFNSFKAFKVGDIIRFDKVGAYTLTLSPLFISYFPPVYAIDGQGGVKCVRAKWGANELIQKSLI